MEDWVDTLIETLHRQKEGGGGVNDDDSPPFTSQETDQFAKILGEIREGHSTDTFYFRHPCTIVVAGPSKCGKTCLVKSILEHDYIQPSPEKVYWFFSEWQDMYKELKDVGLVTDFFKGLDGDKIDRLTETDREVPKLLILDDLQDETADNTLVADLFRRGSHHRNLSVIFITQNIFFQGKKARNIAVNGNYYIIFKNPADQRQIQDFASRIGNREFILNSFEEATCEPHGHLIFDFTQETDGNLRSGVPVQRIFKATDG